MPLRSRMRTISHMRDMCSPASVLNQQIPRERLPRPFAFADISQFAHLSATIDGHADVVTAELVSGNFLQSIGVATVLGRPIEPSDDFSPGSGAVAVISDAFWQRRFARSPSVIGKTVDVNLTPITIVGVAPPGFTGRIASKRASAIMRSLRTGSAFAGNPQSCRVDGCAGVVRWRDRQNHAFASIPRNRGRSSTRISNPGPRVHDSNYSK